MATGLEMYDALHRAARDLDPGAEFALNPVDAHDLIKLTVSDLMSRDYDERVAEEVSSSLFDGDYGSLARSLGIRLNITRDAPSLIPERR